MAEIIDEYIALDERIPAPANTESESNSNFLEKAADSVKQHVVDPVVRLADSINMSGVNSGQHLAIGLRSLVSPEFYQEQKQNFQQRRANAARMAELELQDAETRVQTNQFNLEQAKKNAPLVTQQKQQNLENAQQQGKNLAQQFTQAKEAFPHRLASLKAESDLRQLEAQRAQFAVWDKEKVEFRKKATDNLKAMVNFPQLSIAGQYTFNNSQAVKAFVDMTYLMQSSRDPKKFKYYISEMKENGWNEVEREDGELELQRNVDGKTMSFVANPQGIKKLADTIQTQLKDDLTAAKITGLDAATTAQATTKTVLNNPVVKQICGDAGTAYRIYSDFYNKKILNPKTGEWQEVFSPEQKIYHMLNVVFGAALEDNMFNDKERATLLPQAQQMIKTLGGELKIGDSVENTSVIWGRNQGYAQTYTIKDFLHTILKDKDVITPAFGNHLLQLKKQMKNNQAGGQGANGAAAESNIAWKHRLDGMYGTVFRDAKDTEQDKLVEVAKEMDIEQKDLMQKTGAKTMDDLSLDNLRMLDNEWKNKVADDKFYSPYQDRIFLRERDALYKEKAPLIAKLRELEKDDSDYQEYNQRRKGAVVAAFKGMTNGSSDYQKYVDSQRKFNKKQQELHSLRKKIDGINDGIKMREKKLRSRGVKFKEYN